MLHSKFSVVDNLPGRHQRTRCVLPLIALLVLGGCTSSKPPQAQSVAFAPDAVEPRARVSDPAAEGFVNALVQLPGYSPPEITLMFERRALASDPFLQALETAVTARGYGVRKLTTITGQNLVTHEHAVDPNDSNAIVRTLSFGDVRMRRVFSRQVDGSWAPKTSLFIRGADARGVVLGDGAPQAPAPQGQQAQADTPNTFGDSAPATTGSDVTIAAVPIEPERPATPIARSVQPPVAARSPDAGTPAGGIHTPRNIAETGVSNYAGIFEGYGNVDELILIFPNDSLVLGADNKRLIRDAIAKADVSQDLFSIIGCSFGKTAIENGNELLATGRANRVREELLFSGIADERILDEGCWAGAPELHFPSRGVVLTIKRARV